MILRDSGWADTYELAILCRVKTGLLPSVPRPIQLDALYSEASGLDGLISWVNDHRDQAPTDQEREAERLWCKAEQIIEALEKQKSQS